MKLAGRKMVVSILTSGRPGWSAAMAASTPRVSSRVLAQGNFSTMSRRPGPSLMIPSPIMGWWSTTTLATSFRRSGLPSRTAMGTLARNSGFTLSDFVRTGLTCRMGSR